MPPDPLRVMLLAEARRTNRRLIELEQKVSEILDAVRQLRCDLTPNAEPTQPDPETTAS